MVTRENIVVWGGEGRYNIDYNARDKVCNVVARVITWFESVRQRRVFLTGRHYGVRNGVSSPA